MSADTHRALLWPRLAKWGHLATGLAVSAYAGFGVIQGFQLALDPNAGLARVVGLLLLVMGVPGAVLALAAVAIAWRLPQASVGQIATLWVFDAALALFSGWVFVSMVQHRRNTGPVEILEFVLAAGLIAWALVLAASAGRRTHELPAP